MADRLSRGEKLARQRRPVLLNRHAGCGDCCQHRLHAEHDRQSFASDQIALRAGVAERNFDRHSFAGDQTPEFKPPSCRSFVAGNRADLSHTLGMRGVLAENHNCGSSGGVCYRP